MAADRRLVKISNQPSRRDETRLLAPPLLGLPEVDLTGSAAVDVCVEKDHPGSLGLNHSPGNCVSLTRGEEEKEVVVINLNGDRDVCPRQVVLPRLAVQLTGESGRE